MENTRVQKLSECASYSQTRWYIFPFIFTKFSQSPDQFVVQESINIKEKVRQTFRTKQPISLQHSFCLKGHQWKLFLKKFSPKIWVDIRKSCVHFPLYYQINHSSLRFKCTDFFLRHKWFVWVVEDIKTVTSISISSTFNIFCFVNEIRLSGLKHIWWPSHSGISFTVSKRNRIPNIPNFNGGIERR